MEIPKNIYISESDSDSDSEIDEDYMNGSLYEITCKDKTILGENGLPLCYIGSSKNYEIRMKSHLNDWNNENDKSHYNLNVYQVIRKNGGMENFDISKLYDYPCKNKRALRKEEERMRIEKKANLNTNKAYRSKAYIKQYRLICGRNYYLKNCEKVKKNNLEYYYNNRQKVLEREKKKYNENKTLNLTIKSKKAYDTINIIVDDDDDE